MGLEGCERLASHDRPIVGLVLFTVMVAQHIGCTSLGDESKTIMTG